MTTNRATIFSAVFMALAFTAAWQPAQSQEATPPTIIARSETHGAGVILYGDGTWAFAGTPIRQQDLNAPRTELCVGPASETVQFCGLEQNWQLDGYQYNLDGYDIGFVGANQWRLFVGFRNYRGYKDQLDYYKDLAEEQAKQGTPGDFLTDWFRNGATSELPPHVTLLDKIIVSQKVYGDDKGYRSYWIEALHPDTTLFVHLEHHFDQDVAFESPDTPLDQQMAMIIADIRTHLMIYGRPLSSYLAPKSSKVSQP